MERLSKFIQKEMLQLHGIGKRSLPKQYQALEGLKLTFRTNN